MQIHCNQCMCEMALSSPCYVILPLANVMARRELKYNTMEKTGTAIASTCS